MLMLEMFVHDEKHTQVLLTVPNSVKGRQQQQGGVAFVTGTTFLHFISNNHGGFYS